jgi:hypothetical protein
LHDWVGPDPGTPMIDAYDLRILKTSQIHEFLRILKMPMNFRNKIHSVENKCYRKTGTFHSKPTSQINQNRAPFFAPLGLAEAELRTDSKIP